ncbi:MAG: inner membrane protein [Haloarculaceae archaeon]|jgi:inner membrane protein
MYRTGHLGAALCCGAPGILAFQALTEPLLAGIWLSGLVATASLPDIDQRLPIPHRGPTHSLLFAVVVSSIVAGATAVLVETVATSTLTTLFDGVLELDRPLVLAGVAGGSALVGILSHLLADAITVGRGAFAIKPLWPVRARTLRFGLTTADSTRWNYGLFVVGTTAVVGATVLPTLR